MDGGVPVEVSSFSERSLMPKASAVVTLPYPTLFFCRLIIRQPHRNPEPNRLTTDKERVAIFVYGTA